MSFDIDFVIPWVDGSDQEWIELFNKYAPSGKKKNIDFSAERYRDYGLLKYWFRGVEKFAPYVRNVHFITNGQKPDWPFFTTFGSKVDFRSWGTSISTSPILDCTVFDLYPLR